MAKFEQYSNNAVTTLSSPITAVATTLTVADASRFPTVGNFRILVNGELMLVTSVAASVFTITRGVESTTAAAHSGGDQVALIVTEESFRRLMMEYQPMVTEEGVAGPLASFTNTSGAAVNSASFTATNQGSSTLTDVGTPLTAMKLTPPAGTGSNLRVYSKSAPSTPYTIYTCLSTQIFPPNGVTIITHCGMCFRESGTAKVKVFGLAAGSISSTDYGAILALGNYTNPTTFSTWNRQVAWGFNPRQVWCALEDDGTNIKFHMSNNGLAFQEVWSETRGTFFTTAPDEVGLYYNTNTTGSNEFMYCTHWSEQ
jgi:hypothetical protein